MTWPTEDAEHPEVEQRTTDPQQPVLVELGGAGGPAELVIAVAPQVPDDEGRQAEVGEDHEEELVHRGLPGRTASAAGWTRLAGGCAGLNCGGGEGSEPDLLLGRAFGGESAYGVALVTAQGRQRRGDRVDQAGPRRAQVAQREAQQLQPRPVVEHQVATQCLVAGGGELEDDAQVVGQLAVVELEAGER